MYSEEVMKIFQNPTNAGMIKGATTTGQVTEKNFGDIMKIYLKIENEVIVDAKFKTYGCVASIVATNIICDKVKGKTIENALNITSQEILDEMGDIPENKKYCAVLAQEVVKEAIDNYYKKLEKEKNDK